MLNTQIACNRRSATTVMTPQHSPRVRHRDIQREAQWTLTSWVCLACQATKVRSRAGSANVSHSGCSAAAAAAGAGASDLPGPAASLGGVTGPVLTAPSLAAELALMPAAAALGSASAPAAPAGFRAPGSPAVAAADPSSSTLLPGLPAAAGRCAWKLLRHCWLPWGGQAWVSSKGFGAGGGCGSGSSAGPGVAVSCAVSSSTTGDVTGSAGDEPSSSCLHDSSGSASTCSARYSACCSRVE